MSILANDVAFIGGATVVSNDWHANRPFGSVAVYSNATQAGTVQLFHVDDNGTERALQAAVPITAGVEDVQVLTFHVKTLRVKYVNTNATAGTVLIDVQPGT